MSTDEDDDGNESDNSEKSGSDEDGNDSSSNENENDDDVENAMTNSRRITSRREIIFLSVNIVNLHPCMTPIVNALKKLLKEFEHGTTDWVDRIKHILVDRIKHILGAASHYALHQKEKVRWRSRNASIFAIQLVLNISDHIPKDCIDRLRISLVEAATVALAKHGAPGIDFLLRQVVELLSENDWVCQETDREHFNAYQELSIELMRLAPYTGRDQNSKMIDLKYTAFASYQHVTSDNVTLFYNFAKANKLALFGTSTLWWEEHILRHLSYDEAGDARIGRHHSSPQSAGSMRVVHRRCGLSMATVILDLTADNGASLLRSPKVLNAILNCATTSQDRRLVYVSAGEFVRDMLRALKENSSEESRSYTKDVQNRLKRLGNSDPSKIRNALFASLAKFASSGNNLIGDRVLCNIALKNILDCDTAQRAELLTFLHFAVRPPNDFSDDDLFERLADKIDDLFADTTRKVVAQSNSIYQDDTSDVGQKAKPVVSIALLELFKDRINTLAHHRLCRRIIYDGTHALARALPAYRDPSHRKLGYELLAELYKIYFPLEESCSMSIEPDSFDETPKYVREALLAGLADPDDTGMHDVQKRNTELDQENNVGCRRFVYDFWRERLPKKPQHRLDALFQEVFLCADPLSLRYAIPYLFTHAAQSMKRNKIFSGGLELNNNDSVQLYDHYQNDGPSFTLESIADLSLRQDLKSIKNKRSLEMSCQFVGQLSQKRKPAGKILASVKDSLADFDATQMSVEEHNRIVPSQFLFQKHRNLPSSVEQISHAAKSKANKKRRRVHFAEQEKEENVKSKLIVFRQYRPGEQPDIEISLADVVRPLVEIALRDGELAADLFTQIFIQMYTVRCTERRSGLVQSMQEVLSNRSASSSAELVSTIHRSYLQIISVNDDFQSIPAPVIAESASRARIAESGAVLLEAMINSKMKYPGQSSDIQPEDLVELRRLYAAYHDYDSEIIVCDALLKNDEYAKYVADGRSIKRALALGDWQKALKYCISAGAPDVNSNQSWNIPSNDTSDDAADTLRICISAIALENSEEMTSLIERVQSNEEVRQWTAINTPCALALTYATCGNDLPNARHSVDTAYQVLATYWASTHACAIAARTDCLRELTHVAEIDSYLNACQTENPLRFLLKAWSSISLCADDPPEYWMRSKRSRQVLAKGMSSHSDAWRLELDGHIRRLTRDKAEFAINQLQIDIAKKFLENEDEDDSTVQKLRRSLNLAEARCRVMQVSGIVSSEEINTFLTLYILPYIETPEAAIIMMEYADALALLPRSSEATRERATNLFIQAAPIISSSCNAFALAELAYSALVQQHRRVIIDALWRIADEPIAECVKCAISISISNYIRALSQNDKTAKECAVPRILALLTSSDAKIARSAIGVFNESTNSLPLDPFVPWAYRFMSLAAEHDEKHQNEECKLQPILMRLAREKPSSLQSPLRFAIERLKDRGLFTRTSTTYQLYKECPNQGFDAFVIALQGLQEPALRLNSALRELREVLNENGTSTRRGSCIQGANEYTLRAAKRIWSQLYEELLAPSWPGVNGYLGEANHKFARDWRGRLTGPSRSMRSSFLGKEFNGDSKEELVRGGKLVPKTISDLKSAKDCVEAILEKLKQRMNNDRNVSDSTLRDVSTYLLKYDGSNNYDTALDVPLAAWENDTLKCSVPKILVFDPCVVYLSSMRRPCKIKTRCSDGAERSFLVKGGEDLRNDERIEHIFSAMRSALLSASKTRQKKLHTGVRTYGVFPLSPRVGLVEWIDGAETLSAVVERFIKGKAQENAHRARCAHLEGLKENYGIQKISAYLVAMSHITPESGANAFFKAQEALQPFAFGRKTPLSQYLIALAPQSEAFVSIRNNCIKSVASSSACTYIVGLGDRHQGNIMVDSSDGTIAHIDLGASFGYGTTLPVPEIIPIRLTPQLTSPYAPLDGRSHAKRYLGDTLETFRDRKYVSTLLAMLDVFATDPVLDWIQASEKFNRISNENSETNDDIQSSLTPELRVKIARDKLLGHHPAALITKEIECNSYVTRNRNSLNGIKRLLTNANRQYEHQSKLSPIEQAEVLIDLASDPALLSVHYVGLEPWW
uniref:Non-specific serine/threonine protein kinase n=1 Tax=Aureoumbra lagunensis TaxID=44058 RepID=A0A7S3JTB1_9STRA